MPEVRLIDANALKVRLSGCMIMMPNGEKCAAERAIDTQGTIEAKPVRHGRWIPITNDDFGFASKFKCSYCNDIIRYNIAINKCHYNYCPNCSADMREGGADNG